MNNKKISGAAIVVTVYAVVGLVLASVVWAVPMSRREVPPSETLDTLEVVATEPVETEPPETLPPETTTVYVEPEPILNKNDVFEPDVVTVNNSDFFVSDDRLAEMYDIFDDYKFDTSFYIIDLESGASIGLNADKVHSAASTVKAGFALYCYKQIAAGNASYKDVMRYEERHFLKGSGDTQNSVYGTAFTIKVLLHRQLYNSDNVAHLMLCDFFGIDGYNEMVTELGVKNLLTKKSKFGDFTPQELGLIWQEIYNFKDTCEEGAQLWEELTTNLYNELELELGEDYDVLAHKSGWNSKGYHEAGIVMAERPYVVVVMTETGNKNNCLHKTIRFCDNVMKDFTEYMKNN